jgi:hypothetical protein
MKTTMTVKGTFMRPLNLARIGTLAAALVAVFGLAPAGCIGGWDYSNVSEGNRCNPYDSHNECASGLQCTVVAWQVSMAGTVANTGTTVPALGAGAGTNNAGAYNVLLYCPENYCCPVDSNGNLTTSSNPNCQPGCNGGAASQCTATSDPATCACAAVLDDGGSPSSPECTTPPDAGTDSPPEGATSAEAGTPAEASTPVEAAAGD